MKFWRTLDERDGALTAGDAQRSEFGPDVVNDALPSTVVSRRGFLGFVGATAALATAACTSRERTIVPYTKRPQEIVPGVANYYASTFPEGRRSYSVLVKTREGRPIHLTGNDEHPELKGKTSLRAIADLASLYDPDRVRVPRLNNLPTTWADAEAALLSAVTAAKQDGKRVLLLTGQSDSPSRNGLIADLKVSAPMLDVLYWQPASSDSSLAAAKVAFGTDVELLPRLGEADVIVSLGADFLNGEDPVAIAEFTAKRRLVQPSTEMSRLWVFEGSLSLTGANADQRLPLRPSKLAALAFALVTELHSKTGMLLPVGAVLPPIPADLVSSLGIPSEFWNQLVADLVRAKNSAVVLCGDEMPAEAHVATHLLNAMLGSRAVRVQQMANRASLQDLQATMKVMEAGGYSAAILWGVNPAYSFPNGDRWKAALSKVATRFWIGLLGDESADQCQWVLPCHHWLEAWGDYGMGDVLTLQQPVIAPLYESRQAEDLFLALLKGLGVGVPDGYRAFIRNRWLTVERPWDSLVPFDQLFNASLHDGVYRREKAPDTSTPIFRASCVNAAAPLALAKAQDAGFELTLKPGTQVFDGRYANNGWLQELPDPITKNTWGNPLLVSVDDARELGLESGDVGLLEVAGQSLRTPVLVQPGQAKGVLSLALGYGRTKGTVARGVGTNAYALVGLDTTTTHLRTGVKLTKTLDKVRLPLTQSHHHMDGRDLVRSFTLAEYAAEAKQPRKRIELTTLYPDQRFPEHKWGMSIDLSACVGCAACVIGCQSENNIATVGPEQVERGREMHWIRIDSYYEGPESNPKVVHQPMLCQHCDSAPCENVCPVNATNHSPDGLNQMAYNRCVGTRYCANNCPYKVRRYNFFDYTSEKTEPADLVYNPEVTVRPRGVMEKCTFCVQRIQDARMRAKVEHRPLRDGDIIPACAAACPSNAIVFGDLKNPQSRVAVQSRHPRGYKVLEELGTRPAVTYLADLKNPAISGGSHE
jgi:Fe-S-cluster-containing dehydrogenase component/anaerobic selenocysteine-containing dehydrogenase